MTIDRSRPLIGVVTVLYQSDDVLDDFFASLGLQQDVNLKLYVIDNSATDSGSRLAHRLADQWGIDARIVFNNANLGVARGNNQGIELALADGCEYVLLANNDTEFRGVRTIAELVDRNGKGDVLATFPKIFYHGTRRIWCAGGFISKMKAVVKHVGDGIEDHGQFDQEFVTEYAPTCFTLLHKSVFSRIGVMDEQYFVYYDDVDFVWRMNKAGIRLLYVPSSEVAHKVSFSTGGGESPFTLFYVTRNRIYFSRKSLGAFKSVVAIAYSLAAMLYKYPRFTSAGRKSVLRGIASGLRLGLAGQRVTPSGYFKRPPQREGA